MPQALLVATAVALVEWQVRGDGAATAPSLGRASPRRRPRGRIKSTMSGFVLNYESLKAWAERLGLAFRFSDEAGQIAVLCRVLNSDVPLVFIPRPERGMVTMAVTLPFVVPAERHTEVARALTLLNARSYMGAWILNGDKGEIYFRVTVPALDVSYSDQALRFVAGVVASSAETLAPGLYAVARENAPAASISGTSPP